MFSITHYDEQICGLVDLKTTFVPFAMGYCPCFGFRKGKKLKRAKDAKTTIKNTPQLSSGQYVLLVALNSSSSMLMIDSIDRFVPSLFLSIYYN